MTDTFSVSERSQIMRLVKSKGNKSTEMRLIELFKFNKINGWRRNYPLIGKPDFVIPKKKIVVFADGCFWHGHNCRNIHPKQNSEYWKKKKERNKERDKIVSDSLKEKGWQVFRIWECDLKKDFLPKELIETYNNH